MQPGRVLDPTRNLGSDKNRRVRKSCTRAGFYSIRSDGLYLLSGRIASYFKFIYLNFEIDFCGISRRMREPYEKAAAFYRERIPYGNNTLDKFYVS